MSSAVDHHLDLAGGQIGVFHSLGPLAHRALQGQDELAADAMRLAVGLGLHLGVEDDLNDALAIAKIDEDDPAMIAPAVHPTHQDHFFSCVGTP